MCKVLYVAADKPLPLIPWNESQPAFNVINVIEHDRKVITHFSKPYVYYVATKLGCACDFQYGQFIQYGLEDVADAQEENEGREAVGKLSAYLNQETHRVGELELLCCWEDEQEAIPTSHVTLHPSDFGGASFTLEPGQYAIVLPDAV